MKAIIFTIAIMAATFTACNNNNNNSKEANKNSDITTTQASNTEKQPASVNEIVTAYLQVKNALVNDNSKEAATAGEQLHDALQKLDKASFTADQKKLYDDMKEDLKEHANHIGENEDKIAHQREHFDLISQDMYDLVKAVKPNQTLYKDFCPMYKDNKGAVWISEIKEIKNPYLGKEMLTCGEVKEEIKP